MASQPPLTHTELNAYVDGELPPERIAEIAGIAAHNPEIAQTIAAIASLKAALQEMFVRDVRAISVEPSRSPERSCKKGKALGS